MKAALALLAAALVVPALARADGDPASDYLLFQPYYVPLQPAPDKGLRDELNAMLKAGAAQRHPLRVAGVLVFVEQHHPVALPQLLPHLGEPRSQPRRGGHLHAEVHHLVGTHALVQRVDERYQCGAFGLRGEHA